MSNINLGIKPNILVTGATGKTGSALVAELRQHNWPVRAMVSREDSRSASLQKLGAEIVVADMYDPEQLLAAAAGSQRAYYLPLMRPYMLQAAAAFAFAAREAKLESIVQMSQWTSSRSHPTVMTRQTWLVDQMFSMIPGVAHTIFNPGMFADNFLRLIDLPALLGVYPVIMGDSRCAPISNEDMARCAAALLMDDPAKHNGKSYRPTGTELLSGKDMAGIIARVVGHRVVPVDLPAWMLRKVARMQKIDPFQIYVMLKYVEDNKQGAFSYAGGVTEVMQQLTGRHAESFETTARRYAALPFAQQTFANRLKAFVNFNITPFYPGYNIAAYERSHEIPAPTHALQCMEDESWKQSHLEQMALQGAPATQANTAHADQKLHMARVSTH